MIDVEELNAWANFFDRFKRFTIAMSLIVIFAFTIVMENEPGMTIMAGIIGGVVGFYFGSKNSPALVEIAEA